MEVVNRSGRTVDVDRFRLEYLAFAEPESPSGGDPSTFLRPNIHVESDYNCKGSFTEKETDITEKWVTDTLYTSQRNYGLQTPCILEVSPQYGPDQEVLDGGVFSSFSVYEMPFDSCDRERKGLFQRRFYRTIAPWTTENPVFLHLTSSDPDVIRRAVDQCAEGEAKGLAEGKAEGLADGEAKGRAAKAAEIARAMLASGMEHSLISSLTGLPEEEIKKL